ncbi:hypothetical protein D6827_00420 [Candidatus Parcubacteria bacterium]|nr:MAG: hypothetical protein D6827_00420 [Candidatus Parcubacteria bacterium]
MERTKGLLKSRGILGSAGSLLAWAYTIFEVFRNIPPDLIDDTKAVYVAAVGLVSSIIALIGRWKAVAKIKGLF